MFINGRWYDDKDVVKDKMRDFFKNRFEGVTRSQVRLDNVFFNSISGSNYEMLVGSFF